MSASTSSASTMRYVNFNGWRVIQIPLNIAAADEVSFQAIKQVRITLSGEANAAPREGRVRVGKISFVGNLWEKPTTAGGSSLTVSAINNIDNPNYTSLLGHSVYSDLYEDQSGSRVREQALALNYSMPDKSTVTTRTVYPTPRDFSKHKALRFFVRASTSAVSGETFFMQLGSESDYFEYAVDITERYRDTWVLEEIVLEDKNKDGTPDQLLPLNPSARKNIVGSPKLTSVGQIKIGVRNATGNTVQSELWVNEIHLSGSRLKVGEARRVSADFSWDRWGSFGGKFREVDRNFQTLTSAITNQDKTEESGYLNFTRLRFLPLSVSGSQSETVTPAAVRTGESGLVSVLEEGRVLTQQGSGKGSLVLPYYLPQIGFGYDKTITDSNLLRRIDNRDTYSGSLNYATPWKLDILPTRFFTLRPLPESWSATYRRTNYFLSFYPEKKQEELSVSTATAESKRNIVFTNVRTLEYTDDWSGRLTFAPWTGLNFSPNYSFKKVWEERRYTEGDLAIAPELRASRIYDKQRAQSYGLTASWRVLRWLEPRLNYSISGTETNVLPTVSTPTAFNFKSLDRSADGEGSWSFSARELLPNFRPTQSFNLNNSFRIENGDTYENVENEFEDWRKVEVLQLRKIPRKNGRRMYGLLGPLLPKNATARRKQVTARNTFRSSGSWSPLDWLRTPRWISPIKTFNFTATVTNTDEHSETTETVRDATTIIWPDFIFSLRETEKLFWLHRWMGNSQVNLRTNRKKTEDFNTEFSENKSLSSDYRFTLWSRFDFFLTYARSSSLAIDLRTQLLKSIGDENSHSYQVGMKFGPWRFTPSAAFRTTDGKDGTGKTTQDLRTNTYSLKTRLDKAYPEGFRIPFTKKVFGNVNRLIMDSNLTYEHKKSSLNFERDNTDTYSLDLTGEYEISRNFRLSFGGGGSMLKNRGKKEDGYISYNINSSLVIQF
ncbi:MAG: hypothetical protein HY548_03425 [Elusimicrobia bacterium]|nr:hypothetical protein [Elusimicrobiota bacterium]